MSTKPLIYIVNGSFSPSPTYIRVTDRLQSAGYSVKVSDYPSIGKPDDHETRPAATMADDASHVHSQLEKLADEGNDILVVAHSYGGIPTSEAVGDLGKEARRKEGKKGGVVRVLYVAAVVPRMGGNLGSVMGSDVAPFIRFEGDYMSIEPVGSAKANLDDMPFEEALPWARIIASHSTPSFTGELTKAGYKDVPVSWLFTSEDPVVTPDMQRAGIANIEATGNKVDEILELDAGHFPFLSRPDDTARLIHKAAGKEL